MKTLVYLEMIMDWTTSSNSLHTQKCMNQNGDHVEYTLYSGIFPHISK
jgi:hypothetical protein